MTDSKKPIPAKAGITSEAEPLFVREDFNRFCTIGIDDRHFQAVDMSSLVTSAANAKVKPLQEENARLAKALKSLANEAEGFLSQANPQDHGHTNISVLRHWIENAREALSAGKGEKCF